MCATRRIESALPGLTPTCKRFVAGAVLNTGDGSGQARASSLPSSGTGLSALLHDAGKQAFA